MDQTEWKEEALVLNYSQLLKFAKLIQHRPERIPKKLHGQPCVA